MKGQLRSLATALLVATFVIILAACSATAPPTTTAPETGATATGQATAIATQIASTPVTPAASPTPDPVDSTPSPESTVEPQPEEAQPTPAASATRAVQPTVTPAATATRPRAGVVVTEEPRVEVWSYGMGVLSAQIEGPLRASIAFLNSLIVDTTGNSSLPYLSEALHAETLAHPDDGIVLGIDASYVSYEVNWLGPAGAASQLEAILSYEDGAKATHLLELRRSGEAWQIARVSSR